MSTNGPLRWLCWVPLASMLAAEVYVRRFDGWGAWASAPLLLVPAIVSVAIAVPGILEVLTENQDGEARRAKIQYTVIALLPIVWLFVRRFVT